jgi:flagellum-specific peptidoglycan hydrolase FlgJ
MNSAPVSLVSAVVSRADQYGYNRVPLGLVLAQSALETGYWTSDVFRNGNNAFGMRLASVRDTPAVGVYAGHAKYLNLQDSAWDYWDRQHAFDIPNTADVQEYVRATVASNYATDPNYGAKWLAVYDQAFGDYVPNASGGGLAGAVALGLVAALAFKLYKG